MAFVVTDDCILCRPRYCVAVCPVDCFLEDERMVYIHPDHCIDCVACYLACPHQAIEAASALPARKRDWIGVNARRTRSGRGLSRSRPRPLQPMPRTAKGRSAADAYRD